MIIWPLLLTITISDKDDITRKALSIYYGIKANFTKKWSKDYQETENAWFELKEVTNDMRIFIERYHENLGNKEEARLADHFGTYDRLLKYKYKDALVKAKAKNPSHYSAHLYINFLNDQILYLGEYDEIDTSSVNPGIYIRATNPFNGIYDIFQVKEGRLERTTGNAGFGNDPKLRREKPEWAELIRPIIEG